MEIIFFLTSCIFLLSGLYFHGIVKRQKIYDKVSSIIFFSASACYATMGLLYVDNPYIMIRGVRYFDWFITVPLLLYQLYWFLDRTKRKKEDLVILTILSTLMLSFGLFGELNYLSKVWADIIGSIFGMGIGYILFTKSKTKDRTFFITVGVLWLFYPIVYLIEETLVTLLLFSIVDVMAKLGTGFYIRKKKSLNLK